MKILVAGPESSGTKMVAHLLGQAGAETIHRSFPYGGEWPDLSELDFDVAVVLARDLRSIVSSQRSAGHVDSFEEAATNIQEAYLRIFAGLEGHPFCVVTYESMVARPQAIRDLCTMLDLDPHAVHAEIGDANAKWYGGPFFQDQRPVEAR